MMLVVEAVESAPADLENRETRPFIEKYFNTGTGFTVEERLRLFHPIRDLTTDSYGGWHLVTNLQSGGELFAQRLVTRRHHDMDHARRLARRAAGLSGSHGPPGDHPTAAPFP